MSCCCRGSGREGQEEQEKNFFGRKLSSRKDKISNILLQQQHATTSLKKNFKFEETHSKRIVTKRGEKMVRVFRLLFGSFVEKIEWGQVEFFFLSWRKLFLVCWSNSEGLFDAAWFRSSQWELWIRSGKFTTDRFCCTYLCLETILRGFFGGGRLSSSQIWTQGGWITIQLFDFNVQVLEKLRWGLSGKWRGVVTSRDLPNHNFNLKWPKLT